MVLSQKEVGRIYRESKRNEGGNPRRKSQFGLGDLIGEKIIGTRVVKIRSSNPKGVDVVDFESGRTLITGVEGWDIGTTHHSYLIGQRGGVRYSDRLFNADLRAI